MKREDRFGTLLKSLGDKFSEKRDAARGKLSPEIEAMTTELSDLWRSYKTFVTDDSEFMVKMEQLLEKWNKITP